jgi:hypothetical protein
VVQRRPNPAQEFFDRLKVGTEKIHLDLKNEIAAAKARLRIETSPGQLSRKGLWAESALNNSGKASGADRSHHLR